MANDLSNPVQTNTVSGDGFFEHGTAPDSLFSTVQLAQNGTAAAAPQTIQVAPPQGAAGPVVIRVEVTPGSIVELPQPFEADAALMAKEGDGNLAIRVGDVTIVLQGYVEANSAQPVTIEGADNQPIDIATILASTDPAIDIQTAAGPDAGQNGQGADNSGAILARLEDGNGLGGFEGAGAQDGTELGYRTIDNSIRNDFAETLGTTAAFGFSVNGFGNAFQEGFLRDPAQTTPFDDSQGTLFDTFLHEYRDAVEHPGQAMFAGWADFHGTAVTQNNDFDEYLSQTSQTATVTVTFTNGTGDLVLTNIGDGVTSNGSKLSAEIKDDGHTMFVRRDEATATDSGHALVAVVHVVGPDANGTFTIETILINRIDHHEAGHDTMDLDIQFTIYDGPAPKQQPGSDIPNEGEGGDVPEGPTSPSLPGHLTATFADDVPILDKVTYNNQHDGGMAARSEGGEKSVGSDHGLIDEDWLRGGAHDQGVSGGNAGDNGDTGGGTCVTGQIQVNFGADGAANWDGATEKAKQAEKHAFTLDTAQYLLNNAFPYGDKGLTSGGKPLVVLSVSGDHVTVGIADEKQNQKLAEGKEGDTSGQQPTDPIPGCTIFTLTLDQTTGAFKFELKGPLDHGDSIFGHDGGVSALVAPQPENTIPLQFGVTAMDDDKDKIHVDINIDVNDDVPVARNDSITVLSGSHDLIQGDVISAWNEDSAAGKDSVGADSAVVIGVAAGDLTGDQTTGAGEVIQGAYGKLYLGADGGKYTYTRDPYTPGGVDDVFTYTLKDGDGDTSTATLTIHITDAGVSVALPTSPADTTVYEAGLPDGSNAAANSEHTAGTITITAKDGIETLEIAGESLTLTELKGLGAQHLEISDSDGTLTLTGFDEATGKLTYTYDLTDNNSANSVKTVSFDIKVTDVDNDVGTAKLEIDIVDDRPTANCDTITLDQKVTTTDVQFIIDVSGSMERFSVGVNGYPDNGVGLARYSIEKMLNAHPEIQNVQFVLFDDHASHSVWMTAAQALAYVKDGDNFDSGGGNTNFDRALAEAMGAFDDARPLPQGNQNLVYFFSDGNPNEPHNDPGITDEGNGASQVSKQEWQDFINDPANHITDAFAIGIGNVTASQLAPIAYPDGPANAEPNFLTITTPNNLGALLTTLDNAIVPVVTPITGNVLDNDVSGADGFGNGKLVSLSFDTDGSGAGTDRTTLTFDSTHHSHSIDMGADRGKLVLNDDGSYSYTPPAGKADGTPFYVEYTVQDGDGDISTAKLKIDINTRPETDLNGGGQGADNQANFIEQTPVLIAPQGTVSDDADIHAMTLKLTDRPDGNGVESLGLNAAALLLVSQNSLTVSAYNQATGVITITGAASPAVYQAILRGIEYNNSSDTPNTTDRHVTVVVNDGTFDSVSHTVDICVTPVNDAPDAEINPASFTADEDQWIDLSGKIGNTLNMMISDPDSGNDDVTVTLSVTEGKLYVEDGWTGVQVTNNNSMSVTLKGSVSEINNLLKESNSGYVSYINENNTPTHAVTLTLKVNDNGENGLGGAKFDQDTATIYVNDTNDKPVTDLNGNGYGSDASASFVEDAGAIKIAPSGTVTDDSGVVKSMTVTLANHPDGSAESLGLNSTAQGLVTSYSLNVTSYNSSTGILKITGTAPDSVYQQILQNIVYNNSSDTPNTAHREVDVVVNDGALGSSTHSVDISVTPTNDAPDANINPASFTVDEGQWIDLSGKVGNTLNMMISDPDSANDDVTVTISVTEGKLSVEDGWTGVTVTNNNSMSVTLKGSVAEINDLLKESDGGYVSYINENSKPTHDVTLTLKVDDKGENGQGGAKFDQDTATIYVNDLNAKPVTDLNGSSNGSDNSASYTEDASPVKIAPSGKITDADSANLASMTVTLTNIKDGALESLGLNGTAVGLAAGAGLTVTAYNAATGVLTITGTASLATYQSILQNITYDNDSQNPNTTTRSVTVVVSDGTASSDSHTVSISVTPVNDAPTATITPLTYNAVEQTSLVLSGTGLSIGDVDSNNGTMTLTLKVGEGELTITKGSTGVSVWDNGESEVTITGTLTQINNLLAGNNGGVVSYFNDDNTPSSQTTLTMKINDEGFTGGGDLTATDTAIINIQNTNEAPVACDDNVVTNAGSNLFNIPEWALVYNDSDSDSSKGSFDLISGAAAVFNGSGGTPGHSDGVGSNGTASFTDSGGNGGSFDYKMSDGAGGEDTGHVTVTQDTNGTLSGSNGEDIVVVYGSSGTTVDAGGGDDIVIGGGGDDKLDGGSGSDLIFGQGGDDTMIFGSGDKYDGGSGFDQVKNANGNTNFAYDKDSYLGVEMVDIGDTNDRNNSQNTFSLNAGDLVAGATGTTLGSHSIAMFVIGDHSGSSNGRDNVDLTGFNLTAVATNVSFKDSVTDTTHFFNIYEAAGGVKVAVEAGLDVS